MLRRAVCFAAVTLHISLQGAQVDQNERVSELGLHLDILQIPTGGLAQIPEIRILEENESTLLKDFIFGGRRSQNRLIRGMKGPTTELFPISPRGRRSKISRLKNISEERSATMEPTVVALSPRRRGFGSIVSMSGKMVHGQWSK
jgi:hypothetical protein